MKSMESAIRRLFFYGSFLLAAVAVVEKAANLFGNTLLKGAFVPTRLLEFAAIGLIFSIAMQLHQIRLLLSSKPSDSTK